ncbi:UNVERIFIED_CONTAM: hypothetical protein FKN15_073388 [Acipenser sinensis]
MGPGEASESLLPLKPGQYLDVFPLLKLKLKQSPELQCQQDTPSKAEPLLQNEQGADCLSVLQRCDSEEEENILYSTADPPLPQSASHCTATQPRFTTLMEKNKAFAPASVSLHT